MPERVSGAPPSMLPGAALSSLAARFTFRASRLVSAGRGSTSGSGRCPSAFRGPPPRCCQSLAARFCWQGQHFRLWTGARARFGTRRRSTFEPRGSFLLAGAALQALDGFGAPPPRCCQAQHFRASRLVSARRSTFEPRQGQHFRLWTVPKRVSGPPPLHAARRSTFEPRGSFLLAGARARFGAPPFDAARRSTLEPRGSFLLAGAALLDGARARFGAPPAQHFSASRLVSAGRGSTSGSGRCPSAFRGPPPRCCQAQHFRASRLVSAGRGSTSGLSLAARFCWQGQHFRLWTVPERVSRRPSTFEPRASFLLAGAFRGPPP